MSVLIDHGTRVVVQGITGHQGRFHTISMLDFGTKVVAGVTPDKQGEHVSGVPVFETVREAVLETAANSSVIFVPAPGVKDAALEAIDSGIGLIVVITEKVPVQDSLELMEHARRKNAVVIGPNCPGISSPGKGKLGIMPGSIFRRGSTGVVSRSGTLTYEVVNSLSEAGIGQSTCVGIGGDPIVGMDFVGCLELFEKDPETDRIVLIGEIGGSAEELAAEFIEQHMGKPVFAYIAGRTAPVGKRMGHAGALIERGKGTAESKMRALTNAGAKVATVPWMVPELIREHIPGH